MLLEQENTNDKKEYVPVLVLSIDDFVFHKGKLVHNSKISVKPVTHYYEENDYRKYTCPICDNVGCNHQVTKGEHNCPICGINLEWEDKCLSCAEEAKELEDLEKRANEWIKSQGYNEENLPNDEYVQMKDAFIAGARDYRYMSVVCESTLPY